MSPYFSEAFDVDEMMLARHGAVNSLLAADAQIVVDPGRILNGRTPQYDSLYRGILHHFRHRRDQSRAARQLDAAAFAQHGVVCGSQGAVEVRCDGSHHALVDIEFCLVCDGGASDFAADLINSFLLDYTQEFTRRHLQQHHRATVAVSKARFDHQTNSWEQDSFELPQFEGKYVLLFPRDFVARQPDDYPLPGSGRLPSVVATDNARREFDQTLHDHGRQLREHLRSRARHIDDEMDSVEAARRRVQFMKHAIEQEGCYRLFYVKDQPVRREEDLDILYRLTWFDSSFDVTRQADTGRGRPDFKVSRGSMDRSLVEMKLANSSKLELNLANQLAVYRAATGVRRAILVVIFFSAQEENRIHAALQRQASNPDQEIILIDARRDNKPSGSKATRPK